MLNNNLQQKFINSYQKLFDDFGEVFIAFSGGLDSQVLLHLCAVIKQINPKLKLTAIHINHNLSKNAKKWDEHCKKICQELKVEYISRDIDVKGALTKKNKKSLEALAREMRYKIFAAILPKNAVLFTAHHADDLAETVLLQLFRGAGPKGLAAISANMPFANGMIVRPLLQFTRAEILEYAIANDLKWMEDESNQDEIFARNYIRHKIMPMIKMHWPGVTHAIARSALHCAETDDLLKILAADDLLKVKGDHPNTLLVSKLLEFDEKRQKNILRFWLHQLNLALPSTAKMEQILKTVLHSRYDAMPLVHWDDVEIRRFQDAIYAMPTLSLHDPMLILTWDLQQPLKLPNNLGILSAKFFNHHNCQIKTVIVKFRQGGEKCDSRLLKKIFQEQKIPSWQRNRIPLIYVADKLMQVVGYFVSKNWDKNCEIILEQQK